MLECGRQVVLSVYRYAEVGMLMKLHYFTLKLVSSIWRQYKLSFRSMFQYHDIYILFILC